ncbi:MAG: hypothetical protein ACPL0B_02640, partial [Anaerolineales bacterium]
YFIVWGDERNGAGDVYGARVTPSGVIIDSLGIPISSAVNSQQCPSVSFDGTNYFVVWEDYRNGQPDIYGARVTTNGVVLDVNGIPISTAINYQRYPDVSFDGANYMVVWSDERAGANYDVYGARVTPNGNVLDPTGILISGAVDHQWVPKITYNNNLANYLCVWMDYRNGIPDIYGARVTTNGMVLDPAGIAISTATDEQYFPAIAFDGENYFSVWDDRRAGGPDKADIFGARVTGSGTVIDPLGMLISATPASQNYASNIFDGTNYFLTWSQNYWDGDIYGVRIDSTGTMIDSSSFAICTIPGYQTKPAAAFSNVYNQYFVVWRDGRSGTWDIYGARISENGVLLDTSGIPIATAPGDENAPAVACGDSNYFVVWQDNYIYGARVNSHGVVLDPGGIQISAVQGFAPNISFDGVNYFVVWVMGSDLYGARVRQDGVVLDSSGIQISVGSVSPYNPPSIAFDGSKYFVCWVDGRNGNYDIYGARIQSDGVLIDTNGIAISINPSTQYSPSCTFDGINYIITWSDQRNSINYDSDIYGARVTPDGIVLDPDGLELVNTFYSREHPIVSSSGGNVLISFHGITSDFHFICRILGAFYTETGINENHSLVQNPKNLKLEIYPNPFRNATSIKFQSANLRGGPNSQNFATLKIYDA